MDNPLTPNKIQRLMKLAEDKSFHLPRRLILEAEPKSGPSMVNKSNLNCESSSGILDIDNIEGLEESGLGNMSLSKSNAFNPGEITGRSTGTEDYNSKASSLGVERQDEYGRHSIAVDTIANEMERQTNEINEIMRHSIASNYSFHSKRDLTADEVSLIKREAPIPVQQSTQLFTDSMSMNNSNLSVGAYFKNRCPEFGKILTETDSPERSMWPSISEVTQNVPLETEKGQYRHDSTLDCVPVKQAANSDIEIQKILNNTYSNNLSPKDSKQLNASSIKASDKIKPKYIQPNSSSAVQFAVPKPVNLHKPADILLKNLQSSFRMVSEDTEGSMADNSLSLSRLAEYLSKQSNISVSDLIHLNNQKKQTIKKQPLSELHMNVQEINTNNEPVTYLKDTKKTETGSSSGTASTVILMDNLKISEQENRNVPKVLITEETPTNAKNSTDSAKTKSVRSTSPSSKSRTTLSTVHENFTSFKSADSPMHSSKGNLNTSKDTLSQNIQFKELDKSVDWSDVLRHKRMKQEGLAKEKWANIVATSVTGFVGVSCPVIITITTLTDNWLTAQFQLDDYPDKDHEINIEMPRQPLLLSPGKSEQFTLYFTFNIAMDRSLQYTILLKDASIDDDIIQKGDIKVNVNMPTIQAMAAEGLNKVSFPPILEQTTAYKSFVLISDCPADLQLDLSIVEGDSIFAIKNVQEIKKDDISKVLIERVISDDNLKNKYKAMNKQLCRLSSGNAIKVTIAYTAPKLADLKLEETTTSFKGALHVTLIGNKIVLRKVDLIGVVGTVALVPQLSEDKLHVKDTTTLTLTNTGSLCGSWIVKFKTANNENSFPYKITPSRFEVHPGESINITLTYTGSDQTDNEASIVFDEVHTGQKTAINLIGGSDKPKLFPIKTNHNNISFVRNGRKDISLKNSTEKRVHIRCQIIGEGFSIDMPGVESRGIYCLPFGPSECRSLPIVFSPTTNVPQSATLHLVYDRNSDFSRKIKLYGCAMGEPVRWSGLVTYGDTALVRAASRSPVELRLYNKSATAAFVCARVHFNLQYMCIAESARLVGARRIIPGRGRHTLSLVIDWPRLERRARDSAAAALATVTVLTGSEFTRRRILKILKDENNGQLEMSTLPENLKMIAESFDGEDLSVDNFLKDFKEPKASLGELISGLQELNAQIDLPQDFADENTIIITDDTVIEHHTLCD